MMDPEKLNEAVHYTIQGLLRRQYYDVETGKIVRATAESKSAEEALKDAIDLGGGHSLHPNIGPYWFADFRPGFKLSFLRGHGGADEIFEDHVKPATVLEIAREYWADLKCEPKQLSLFK